MISVSDGVSEGDRVFAWFSPTPTLGAKKVSEMEYALVRHEPGKWLKLKSDVGYSVIFTAELLQGWYGSVRKA